MRVFRKIEIKKRASQKETLAKKVEQLRVLQERLFAVAKELIKKKRASQKETHAKNGADKRIRTADLILTKDVLCLLSYISNVKKEGEENMIKRRKWQGQKDLNPRHVVLETTALPSELYPYKSDKASITDT